MFFCYRQGSKIGLVSEKDLDVEVFKSLVIIIATVSGREYSLISQLGRGTPVKGLKPIEVDVIQN
jgi:hypothetical protein